MQKQTLQLQANTKISLVTKFLRSLETLGVQLKHALENLTPLNTLTYFLFLLLLLNAPWYGVSRWDSSFVRPLGGLFHSEIRWGGLINSLLTCVLLFLCILHKVWKNIDFKKRSTQILFIGAIGWIFYQVIQIFILSVPLDKFTTRSLFASVNLFIIAICIKPILKKIPENFQFHLIGAFSGSSVLAILGPFFMAQNEKNTLEISTDIIRYVGANLNPVALIYGSTFLLLASIYEILLSPDSKGTRQKISFSRLLPPVLFSVSVTGLLLTSSRIGLLSGFIFLLALRFAAMKKGSEQDTLKRRLNGLMVIIALAHLSPNIIGKYAFFGLERRHLSFLTAKIEKNFREFSEQDYTFRAVDSIVNTSGRTIAIDSLFTEGEFDRDDFIWGQGAGASSRLLESNVQGVREPHNELVRAFYNHGLVGTTFLLLVLGLLPLLLNSPISRCALIFLYFGILTENFFYYPVFALVPLFTLIYLYDFRFEKREKLTNVHRTPS